MKIGIVGVVQVLRAQGEGRGKSFTQVIQVRSHWRKESGEKWVRNGMGVGEGEWNGGRNGKFRIVDPVILERAPASMAF